MLSKSEIKELKSLHQKKYREGMGRFLAEGDKLVREAIRSEAAVREIYALPDWDGLDEANRAGLNVEFVNQKQLDQICELRNPNQAVALISIPTIAEETGLTKGWHIYLNRLRDPGNLGTILRIADWYGLQEIICSPDSVEPYNQKVVQASMGAVFRVTVREMSEDRLISTARESDLALYATVMDGESIHSQKAGANGILLMGNEAQGLSSKLLEAASHQISIPGRGSAESLNVGVATGILTDWALRGSAED
jgi:TrmH family RNA methyltransferase